MIAARRQADRHAHRPRRQPPAPLGAEAGEAGIVELHVAARSGGRNNRRSRTGRRASTPSARSRPVMLGNSAGGLSRSMPEPHRRDSGCWRGRARPRATARSSGEATVSWPSSTRSLSVASPRMSTTGVGQPLELALQELRRRPLALQPVAAAVDAERQPRGRPARQVERRRPAPARPAALAADRRGRSRAWCRSAPGPGRRPARSTRAPRSNLSRSGSASRWKAMRSPPSLISACELDQRAARADVGLAAHAAAARLAADAWRRCRAGRSGARRYGCRSREGSGPSWCSA